MSEFPYTQDHHTDREGKEQLFKKMNSTSIREEGIG